MSHWLVHTNLQSWPTVLLVALPYQKIVERIFCNNQLTQEIALFPLET